MAMLEKKDTRFEISYREDIKGWGYVYIFVDTKTGVQYFYQDHSMAVMLDENGKPLIDGRYRREK